MGDKCILIRSKRKILSDGPRKFCSEAAKKLIISKFTRSLFRRTILSDQIVLDRPMLLKQSGRVWDIKNQNDIEPTYNVDLPDKKRISNIEELFNTETSSSFSPMIVELSSCAILAPYGLGITNSGQIIKDTVTSPRQTNGPIEQILCSSIFQNGIQSTNAVLNGTFDTPNNSESCALSLVPLWNNYYHWTIECLPRLIGLEFYKNQTKSDPIILLPSNTSSWMLDSLKLMGIDNSDIKLISNGVIFCEKLVVPTFPNPSLTECKWLRKQMYQTVDIRSNIDPQKRIYISRNDAHSRRVTNENEVIKTLAELGFERYKLSDLSIREQVKLFSDAELVVSAHGAGLANIVYSRSPTVLELFGNKQKTTFYRLCKLLGFEYHAMSCEPHKCDLEVPTDELRSIVKAILRSERDPILSQRVDE